MRRLSKLDGLGILPQLVGRLGPEIEQHAGEMGIERHRAVEEFERLLRPAEQVQLDADHAVPIGEIRIERNRLLGGAQRLVEAALPGKGHRERPQRIRVPFIEPHRLLRRLLSLFESLGGLFAPSVRIGVRQRRGEEGESRRKARVEFGGAPEQPLGLAVRLLRESPPQFAPAQEAIVGLLIVGPLGGDASGGPQR